MKDINYSVIIRTTGKAGEKYKKLLQSIKALKPKPKEVIVILPNGYELPTDRLGWETFYYSPKGMVIQRLTGINICNTPYALITDDDIVFDSDFVQKLFEPVENRNYGIAAGPLIKFFPKKGIQSLFAIAMGSAIPTVFHKDRYNTLLKTTGYSYNRNVDIKQHRLYETQSAPWTCFFANIPLLKSIHFEDEIWLDKFGYSAYDDTAMFYKAWLNGVKSVIVSDAWYDHLDAKTSKRGIKIEACFAAGFNMYIFWHRFIYSIEKSEVKRFWCRICISYRIFGQYCYNLFNLLRKHISIKEYSAFKAGVKEAKKWKKSKEYKNLNPVYKIIENE